MNEMNKQYSYTDMESFISSLAKYDGWLMTKQGLTLKQEIEKRAQKDQDNASSTADIIVFSTLVIEDNSDAKLDDKIRNELHKTSEFMQYERFNNANKKHEWSLVKIDDLVPNFSELREEFIRIQSTKNILNDKFALENFIAVNFLFNSDFINALDKRVYNAKRKAVRKLLGINGYKDITLRPWQAETVDEMIEANKFYNLLSLAPRFGKTITVLEYTLEIAKKTSGKVILLPASKNLASNFSFEEDYVEAGYEAKNKFKICDKGSLYVASKDKKLKIEDLIAKRIEIMKEHIDKDTSIVMVTDEADIASHTENSTKFIEAIKTNFKVIKQIAMSGTGIFKAAKIFKSVPADEIFFKTMNYTELGEYGVVDLVKRNFFNVKYNMENLIDDEKLILKSQGHDLDNLSKKLKKSLEILNINQAFDQITAWPSLIRYLRNFIDGDATKILKFQESKAVMVFTPYKDKTSLINFSFEFQKANPDLKILELHGEKTNNRKAQNLTKKTLDEMKKMGDTRQLVILSMAMGSRSYSVPAIRRVIIIGDGDITSSWYQKSARCLTYDYELALQQPLQEGDIIRISFGTLDLFSEIFLTENEYVKNNDEGTNTRTIKQLKRNSFVDVTMKDEEDMLINIYGNNKETATKIIDDMLKYTDKTKYLMVQLADEPLNIDNNLSKKEMKTRTKIASINLNVPPVNPKGKIGKGTIIVNPSDMTAVKEKALKVYVEVLRTLPYIASELYEVDNLEELIGLEWDSDIIIDKEEFKKNLKIPQFRGVVEMIFRNVSNKDKDIITKLEDYAKLLMS